MMIMLKTMAMIGETCRISEKRDKDFERDAWAKAYQIEKNIDHRSLDHKGDECGRDCNGVYGSRFDDDSQYRGEPVSGTVLSHRAVNPPYAKRKETWTEDTISTGILR